MTRHLNIIHLVSSLDPRTGGPPAVVLRLAAAQAALGHAVHVTAMAPDEDRVDAVNDSLNGIPYAARCRRSWIDEPSGRAGRAREAVLGSATRRHIRALISGGRCDVLHLHGVWEGGLRAAAAEAAAQGVPYVVCPHGMLDPWSLRRSGWKKRLALALGCRRMLSDAAFLHALNADEMAGIGLMDLPTPVEVLPNGIFAEEIEPLPPRDAIRKRLPDLGERPYVLFLARLHFKKGLDILASAFAAFAHRHPDWMLVVAGPESGAGPAFARAVAEAGVSDRVLMPGPLYGGAKLEALAGAEAFVLPSRQEGFSIAITEALGCGCPVVISDACHFPEVAEAGAGVIVPLTADAVADGLDRVCGAETAERAAMGAAGRELVLSRFTWPRIARQSIGLYEGVIAPPSAAPAPAGAVADAMASLSRSGRRVRTTGS